MTGIWRLFGRFGANRRFWKCVDARGPGDCWPWTGPAGSDGLPRYDGMPAHVRAYELARGPIPPGARLSRRCADQRCVNPDHLELTP
jgi:hypothetical protein